MYIKVRDINAKPEENDIFIYVSKTSKIEQIKKKIEEERGIKINSQRLLYKGKQLENDLRVFDYDIRLNDVLQLIIRSEKHIYNRNDDKEEEGPSNFTDIGNEERKKADSKFFKIGDLVDAHDPEYTAWFEGTIVALWENNVGSQSSELNQENVLFQIKLENFEHFADLEVEFKDIRPRSYYTYKRSELKEGMKVLVNYNIDEPDKRGFWYNCILTNVTKEKIKGNILVGGEQAVINDCVIKFPNEILRIETSCMLTEKKAEDFKVAPLRKYNYRCINCKDNKKRKCKECGCCICGLKNSPELIILCDECNYGHHTKCLIPPLEKVPEEDWFCPTCKVDENEIVKAGEKLKFSKKKAKMASSKNTNSNRDWGRGMACVGRTKECTIVAKNHYGPIPGVEVGTCWKFRLQVSEAGVHRPHVAGIHGRETDGAYSLVLSGGYEDDVDLGVEFYYTGSGGRDLSGNKRVSGQSCDQSLTRMNKALALNCNAEFNDLKGATAKDWRNGKPVRVVRNFKLGKHSKYAPREGNRYDGIYKVVKYYPEKGKSGFVVWKYLLRRDDPSPAPWSKNGKELDILYPPGYTEAEEWKKKEYEEIENTKEIKTKGAKRAGKKIPESSTLCKKYKQDPYILETELIKLINQDDQNLKLWNECKQFLSEGKQKFLSKVEELFLCICCQDVVHLPITTECKHNICQDCMKRSFSAEIYTCPCCRSDMGRKYKMTPNEALTSALKLLFPGYTKNR